MYAIRSYYASTGSATRGADGDINFLRWGNSGGLPVIVLAPVDVSDCFTLTMHAFNLAEKFRCPVRNNFV